jgi:hypothetical protein
MESNEFFEVVLGQVVRYIIESKLEAVPILMIVEFDMGLELQRVKLFPFYEVTTLYIKFNKC